MKTDTQLTHPVVNKRAGVAYGLAAYLAWGFIPLYFKSVSGVPAIEVLAHRILWSLVFLLGIIWGRGRLPEVLGYLRDRATMRLMAVTTVLIAVNWLVFIWAVFNGRLLEASLGYFINPLVNVLLGCVFLKERLRPWQLVAVGLASCGVLWLAFGTGTLPWIALVLAFSFGFYGLLRKIGRPGGIAGLTVETLLLAPVAAGWLVFSGTQGTLVFAREGVRTTVLLLAAGPVTALPLIWFAEGARRLRLATIGFLQYLAPSLQFLMAVLVFGEKFGQVQLVSFGLIWAALVLYSIDTAHSFRRPTLL